MWGYVLVGLALAGQVTAGGDQYSNTNAGSRQSAAPQGQDQNANSGGLVPILDSTADADIGPPPNVAPLSGAAPDPYGSAIQSTAPIGGGSARGVPFGGSSSTPVNAGASPTFGGLQNRPPARVGAAPPPAATTIDGVKPSTLMRDMLTPPPGSQLGGRPMGLAEVVATAGSRAEQTQRVEAYWDLCSSVADYYLGLREQEELRNLISVAPHIGPTLQQAAQDLVVRISTSQRAALASQYRLASLLGGGATSLPLPRDIPHCGILRSHYQQIFAGRPSAEAQELSALLPQRYAELKNAAVSVKRAEDFVLAVAGATDSNSDRAGTAKALELLALHRRAFVQIARDYNRRIARYSELATPGEVDASRLVRMLILPSGESTATRSAIPTAMPNRQSNSADTSPQNTFADDWEAVGNADTAASAIRDANVAPASAESPEGPREERSLLVKPQ